MKAGSKSPITLTTMTHRVSGLKSASFVTAAYLGLLLAVLALSGCVAPIGADPVTTRKAYDQVEANALHTGKPGANTAVILHRYDLDDLASQQPDLAVRQLHEKAVATGERDLLFALAELSYVAGEKIRRGVKPWDARDARDYYLGSAVYAWLFLFGDAKDSPPSGFDRRFRVACDLYNCSLGLALSGRRSTNATVHLKSARRQLPVGQAELQLDCTRFPSRLEEFDEIVLADRYRVRGLTTRNREPGLGAPVVCVRPMDHRYGARPCTPGTVLLRGPSSVTDLEGGGTVLPLEVYSAFGEPTVEIGETQVPLEIDLTTYRAYSLNSSRIWKLGRLEFLAPAERFPNHLILNQPFEPDQVPIVLVHGTFSSPVTWAEMANTLAADPVLRQRYQFWTFMYGSGNPLAQSVLDLRKALTAEIQKRDPAGTNTVLRQMVVIGHSQGGLLTKGTAIDAGDKLWAVFSTNRLEDLDLSEERRTELRNFAFLKPLPFVKRVVFIATPHRGSYLAGGFARRWAQRLVSLPSDMVSGGREVLKFTEGSEAGKFLRGRMPTSLDGMSPKNPSLLAMADLSVVPEIKAHSIIPVLGDGDCQQGRDGVVSYQSAHVESVESEFIVRAKHSCLGEPATVEEVRRILYEHLKELN